ncbi:MAG: 1-deoxy-D-xylulose-5-phosphate reductoisomerase [Candidatus Eisenbacteria bacterium]|nr:1-deoxy-D-xylulose-5-phosphate reductoisomerase [Candidatus Eisenbacteria bacterium]
MTNVVVLGSTGSIGRNCLSVVRDNASRFRVVGLAAGSNIDLLAEQVREFAPGVVAVGDARAREEFSRRNAFPGLVLLGGEEGLRELSSLRTADVVVNGLVGACGLVPTLAAVKEGKRVALANKESIVLAGEIVMKAAAEHGATVLPVDSEHSGVHQCLSGRDGQVRRIVLTASGGPFLGKSADELLRVTPKDVMRHPVWKMGRRICADSATLLNKGFEVMEARWLFGVGLAEIGVLIHPQCAVHALVEFTDGTTLAQISVPDMRIPILYALSYPDRLAGTLPACDLSSVGPLVFSEPDLSRFPCLRLAYSAAAEGGRRPAQLNAADEVAVRAFFDGRIRFVDIAVVLERSLTLLDAGPADSVEIILEADAEAREAASRVISELS